MGRRRITGLLAAASLLACGGSPQRPEAQTSGGSAEKAVPSTSAASSDAPDASGPTSASLPERLELLGGRLRIRAPKGARVAARPQGIMAAEASDDDETRVIVVPGDGEVARFVLLARESFALGSGNVEKDAPKLLGKEAAELSLTPAKVGKGLSAVALEPKKEIGAQGALFVLGAVVERSDRTLSMLSFHILPSMGGERAEWEAKAAEMLGTLEAGSGALPGSRSHRLPTGTGKVLLVDLPRKAVRTQQKGPDFFVYHLRELAALDATALELGVYVGDHPSYQWKQMEVGQDKVKKSGGNLLGKKTEWFTWTSNGVTVSEAIASLGSDGKAHVFVKGTSAGIAELRKAAGSMRVEAE